MLDKGKISALQMAFLLYPTILATGFLVVPTASAKHAQNDLWMSSLLSFFLGFVAIATAHRLHRLFPKQTIIQYSERIIGKAGGSIIGLVYVFVSFHACGSIVRQYAEFVKVNFMFKTPTLLIIGTMILLAAFAVRGGVELVARSALLLTPIFIFADRFPSACDSRYGDIQYISNIESWNRPCLEGSAIAAIVGIPVFSHELFPSVLDRPGKGKEMESAYLRSSSDQYDIRQPHRFIRVRAGYSR